MNRKPGIKRALKDKRPYLSDFDGVGAAILSRPILSLALPLLVLCGCVSPRETLQTGSRIIVAGRAVPTEARVITWTDPDGLDGYGAARLDDSGKPRNFGDRHTSERNPVATGDLDALVATIDQIVLHYDGLGDSRRCFEMLGERQLSAHFLIDVEGRIYQTLDVQERAYHATVANSRSIGIEIANIGANPAGAADAPQMTEAVQGTIQDKELLQPRFTDQQYTALSALIETLCATFPRIEHQVPRDTDGNVVTSKLSDEELAGFRGVLGHFHVQENKVDPGPAFEWDRLFSW